MFSSYQRVCVVGAGPAGLAAAIALRRNGCIVTVLDWAIPPIDKACGEGLMPDGVQALHELGIDIPGETGFPFCGIRFADGRSSVFAEFPSGIGKGLRRTALHELLVQHANSLGISAIWNAKHVQLTDGGIFLGDRFLAADLVVGADGQKSQIRRQAGLNRVSHENRRYGFRRHYRIAPWSAYMELHWGTRSQVYVTPIAADEICVAVISRHSKLRLEQAIYEFPELSERLRNAEPVSQELGALSISRRLHRVQHKNVVLVGDASGSVDAITGEGICLAAKQACALATALESDDIRSYQLRHRTLMRRSQTMASLMLMLERDAGLQRRALAGLAQHPEVFQSLLAVHVGASPFRDLCSCRLLNFGRAFLAA
jgi:2-polyprenyl-6-methoxyphenol hydroxylase-like FAD-dependent oxidoreductase